MTDRTVAVVVFDGFQALDAVGPIDVLTGLNQYLDATGQSSPRYAVATVATEQGPVRAESGLTVMAERGVDDATGPLDTMIVVGGTGVLNAADDSCLVAWVRDRATRARRVCSVCSGAFVLAAAGVLDGHTVTTHWARADELAAAYPGLTVDPEPIHLRSGKVWTSAGVTAGIDLALALVEEDHGAEAAQIVARWLVMFLRRPGGQSQFAAPVWADLATPGPARVAQDAVNMDPGDDHTVGAMADRASMSARHFTRVFSSEVGCTPARYVEQVRVDFARIQLESDSAGLTAVASACGFGTTETMRRAFLRQVGVSPSAYRGRFRIDPEPSLGQR